MRKVFLFMLSLLFFITACKQNPKTITIREGEPDVYNVESSDIKMNAAIENAKKSINLFEEAITSNNPEYEYFSIKQKFGTQEGGEHIWIQDITIKNSKYIGVVGNVPVNTDEVKLGDTISIDENRITDWMYLDQGVVRGGYTIRVLREQMNKEEQREFDLQSGLIFD